MCELKRGGISRSVGRVSDTLVVEDIFDISHWPN